MDAVVRTYSGKGAKELFDVLEKHKKDVATIVCMLFVSCFVSGKRSRRQPAFRWLTSPADSRPRRRQTGRLP